MLLAALFLAVDAAVEDRLERHSGLLLQERLEQRRGDQLALSFAEQPRQDRSEPVRAEKPVQLGEQQRAQRIGLPRRMPAVGGESR